MSIIQDTAMMWFDHGIVPVPAMYKSKIPSTPWRIWQNKMPPNKVVQGWFADKASNIALICGGQKNLAVIDFDQEDSYYKWRSTTIRRSDAWADVAGKTFRVKTSRGMHLYVYTKNKELSRKVTDEKIDIRAQGGIVITSPSVHPSGAIYTPIGTPDSIVTVGTIAEIFPIPIQEQKQIKVDPATGECLDFISQSSTVDRQVIRDLKNKINILNFVSIFTRMMRTSVDGRWWMGKCISPLHDDKHPSFRVDTYTQRASCLSGSCNLYDPRGLDIFDLYSRLNGVTFMESVRDISLFYL